MVKSYLKQKWNSKIIDKITWVKRDTLWIDKLTIWKNHNRKQRID